MEGACPRYQFNCVVIRTRLRHAASSLFRKHPQVILVLRRHHLFDAADFLLLVLLFRELLRICVARRDKELGCVPKDTSIFPCIDECLLCAIPSHVVQYRCLNGLILHLVDHDCGAHSPHLSSLPGPWRVRARRRPYPRITRFHFHRHRSISVSGATRRAPRQAQRATLPINVRIVLAQPVQADDHVLLAYVRHDEHHRLSVCPYRHIQDSHLTHSAVTVLRTVDVV